MAELTPSTFDVLFRPGEGLRKLADQVSRNVTEWYRDIWWKTTSIAAVDFFHSTDIIDVTIEATLKRSRCSSTFVPPTINSRSSTFLLGTSTERSFTSHENLRMFEKDSGDSNQMEKSELVTDVVEQTTTHSMNPQTVFNSTSTTLTLSPSTVDITTTAFVIPINYTSAPVTAATRKQRLNKLKSFSTTTLLSTLFPFPSTTPISSIIPQL